MASNDEWAKALDPTRPRVQERCLGTVEGAMEGCGGVPTDRLSTKTANGRTPAPRAGVYNTNSHYQ